MTTNGSGISGVLTKEAFPDHAMLYPVTFPLVFQLYDNLGNLLFLLLEDEL